MKKLLLILSIVSLSIIFFGFKKEKNVENLLCNKLWVTNSSSDPDSKVFIEFKSNNTYEHRYMLNNSPTLYAGKWSIGTDKKIHIEFNNITSSDVYEIVSISNSKLEIKTESSGLKKFSVKK
jgi:hypothetical protein